MRESIESMREKKTVKARVVGVGEVRARQEVSGKTGKYSGT